MYDDFSLSRHAKFYVYYSQNSTYRIHFNQWKFVSAGKTGPCFAFYENHYTVSIGTNQTIGPLLLKAVWLDDVAYYLWLPYLRDNFKLIKYNKERGIVSLCANNSFATSDMICQNMSAFDRKQQQYLVYLRHKSSNFLYKLLGMGYFATCHFQCSPRHKMLSTWKGASQVCKQMQGSLPHFTSRTEFETFLAFIIFHHDICPTEAMFIGLVSSCQVCV